MNDTTKTVEKEEVSPEEEKVFVSVRAADWDEFFGQDNIKVALHISITAAKKREEALEHILLYGPPGLGKTTLSHLIAREMGGNIKVTSGPAIERAGDLAAILTNLEKGDILFIDEIHRLNKVVEEVLYPAMEDYALDIVIGKGPSARTVRLDLPQFTIIGATTRAGMLSNPLRDRFGVIHRLNFYEPEVVIQILEGAAKKLDVGIDQESKKEIAARSRGTPRIALKLLKRVRDVAQVHGDGHITLPITRQALQLLDVDTKGLDELDVKYLKTIIEKFSGGPVGLDTLASTLSEDSGTLEDMVEPYLMQIGFIQRTARGRMVTLSAYQHFGLIPPASMGAHQESLLE